MSMQRHIFDGVNRVSQKNLESQPVLAWVPPTIEKGGKLVQAVPRETSQFEQFVTQSSGDAAPDATASADKQSQGNVSPERYDAGYEQGLLLGRKEGLSKGMEEGQKAGYEEGYQQGLQAGQAEGLAQGEQQSQARIDQALQEQLQTLNALMTHLTHALNEQDYQLEQALLQLVKTVSKEVVGRDLSLDSSHIMQLIKQALGALPATREHVRIYVSQQDVELVMKAAEQGGENWRVIASNAIEPGGCRVETDHSLVDFTVAERFQQAISHVIDGRTAVAGKQSSISIPDGESWEAAPEPVVKPILSVSRDSEADKPEKMSEQAARLSDDWAGSDDD
ncbi:hypothetical protein GCM10011403_01890 [Pseudohongiella nitratireducens]|jgi:flagellar assembly protein FliH|uniref:Flagellar assembly protein FliH n=1 Tax=Pseudohongiella nitratireducens TaxID=1768907 RepID=A0A917GJE7_9GAMM|nr:flagellar assembly protein FliH [Pseudohongiella nitratireducens]MDF1623596.1 flagellar assembly protein FliH [Pseudohongiella nitratireducens]GGG48446.1 hypothetical protein GCM10011403_01890 [Pseudohongiella nitratireducens]